MGGKRLSFIVLIVLIVLLIVPISYAIYKSSTNVSGNLVAATWNVSVVDSGSNHLSVIADPSGTQATYNVSITSQSQVDMIYSIVVESLPSGVSVSLDGGTFVEESSNKVIFPDVGTVAYTDVNKTQTHTLTFKAGSTSSFVSNHEVNVNVIARQALQ